CSVVCDLKLSGVRKRGDQGRLVLVLEPSEGTGRGGSAEGEGRDHSIGVDPSNAVVVRDEDVSPAVSGHSDAWIAQDRIGRPTQIPAETPMPSRPGKSADDAVRADPPYDGRLVLEPALNDVDIAVGGGGENVDILERGCRRGNVILIERDKVAREADSR